MSNLGKTIIIKGLYTLSAILAFLTIYLFIQNMRLWSESSQDIKEQVVSKIDISSSGDVYVERQYTGLLMKQRVIEEAEELTYSFDLDNAGLDLSGLTLTVVYDPAKLKSPQISTTVKSLSIPKKGIKETFDIVSKYQFLTFNILSENKEGINQPFSDIVKIKFRKILPIAINYSIDPAFYFLPTTFEDIVQPKLKSLAERLFVVKYPFSQGVITGTSFLVRLDVTIE